MEMVNLSGLKAHLSQYGRRVKAGETIIVCESDKPIGEFLPYPKEVEKLRPAQIAGMSALPWLHRDPYDRHLISHARAENLILLTSDRQIKKYDVPVFWE